MAPRHQHMRFLSCILHSTTIIDGRGFCAFPFRKMIVSEPSMGSLCLISVMGQGLTMNTRIAGQWLTTFHTTVPVLAGLWLAVHTGGSGFILTISLCL